MTDYYDFLLQIVIPFGLRGIIGFSLQGIEMSFPALIGVLGLIGLLVNDSLVMVAYLNRIKLAKSNSSKALYQGQKKVIIPWIYRNI